MANDPTNDANDLEKQSEVQQTQKELLADIKASLIAQSDSVGSSLGRDMINVRRHLLEMKKMNSEQLDNLSALNDGLGFQVKEAQKEKENSSVEKANDLEAKTDMMSVFQEISKTLKNQPDALAKSSAKESGSMANGLMGGMGKMMSGLGIGIGAAGVGAAAVIGAGAYLLNVLDDIDAEKIKENVTALLSINDSLDNDSDSFIGEGGRFFGTMLGLGLGLAAFSIGSGAAAAVTLFTEGSDWPETIKENVATLLSISELPGFGWDAAGVAFTLGGLGAGLAVFALGKGVGAIAELGTAGVEKFTEGGNWAQDIKDNVNTLLSITDGKNWDAIGDAAGFAVVMTGLAAGLVLFAVGKTGSSVGDAVTLFQGKNFAKDIKSEVETLLSISQIEGIGWDTATFILVMEGLGLGLLAFGAGKGISGIADITTQFAGQNFAKDIKAEVSTLLEIPDLLGDPETTLKKAQLTTSVLGEISKGLAAFGAGKFIAGLGQAMESAVGFFTGTDSPVVEALKIGERSDDILKGVNALDQFKGVLDNFSTIGNIDFKFDTAGLADDLLKASNIFELAFEGGTDYRGSVFGVGGTEYTGFVNIEGIDEGIEQINKIKEALFSIPSGAGVEINANSLADQIADKLMNLEKSSSVNIINQGDHISQHSQNFNQNGSGDGQTQKSLCCD